MIVRDKLLFKAVKQIYRDEPMPFYEWLLDKLNALSVVIMMLLTIINSYFYKINNVISMQIVGFSLAFITINSLFINYYEYLNLSKYYKNGKIFSNITHSIFYIVKKINNIIELIVSLTIFIHIIQLIVFRYTNLNYFYTYILEICILLSIRTLLLDYIIIDCNTFFISGRKKIFYNEISSITIIKKTFWGSEDLVWTKIRYNESVAYDKFFLSDFNNIKRKFQEVVIHDMSLLQ